MAGSSNALREELTDGECCAALLRSELTDGEVCVALLRGRALPSLLMEPTKCPLCGAGVLKAQADDDLLLEPGVRCVIKTAKAGTGELCFNPQPEAFAVHDCKAGAVDNADQPGPDVGDEEA